MLKLSQPSRPPQIREVFFHLELIITIIVYYVLLGNQLNRIQELFRYSYSYGINMQRKK